MDVKIMLNRLKKFNQVAYVEYLLENSYLINDSKNYFTNLRLMTIYLRQVKNLKPGEKPYAEFLLADGEELVKAYEYCNLHSLWSN